MVTIDATPRKKQGNTYEFSFTGLSTDTKPVDVYEGKKIANGSSFFNLDTQSMNFYDEAGKAWR